MKNRRSDITERIGEEIIRLLYSVPVILTTRPEIRYKIFKAVYNHFINPNPDGCDFDPELKSLVLSTLKCNANDEIIICNIITIYR